MKQALAGLGLFLLLSVGVIIEKGKEMAKKMRLKMSKGTMSKQQTKQMVKMSKKMGASHASNR